MTQTVQTVTGAIAPERLGRTLMHEHLQIAYPGWESHSIRPGPSRAERVAVCIDRIEELKSGGITSLLDPCPADLGRDAELIAEVAQRTRFQIICATGLYKESEGGSAYWKFRGHFGSSVDGMAELFIREITEGIGSTGVRAGIIKVATGPHAMSDYERDVVLAAAKASVATGAPITTHTDRGTVGDVQQRVLVGEGVPSHRIVIGHSCGTSDHGYHMKIARGGSYLGFDRFGLDALNPDSERVSGILKLIEKGAGDRIVVSHDSVWCWRGEPFANPAVLEALRKTNHPLHFTRRMVPMLREGGASDAQIEALLLDNPRRFFAGEKLPSLA
jgi:phosphotriesterase-related protein